MITLDRIRLTGLLTKSPAFAGLFHFGRVAAIVRAVATAVIGRDDVLVRLRAFLDANSPDGPQALVLEGEAGIGKSTIWEAGVELADELGLRVLTTRPAEAEKSLTFAGIGDLFEDVLDEILPALPPPRRRALEIAVLLVEEAQDPLDPRALGVAVRSAVELLDDAQPLVVAIDDVQWLDGPSAAALAFAVRRTASSVRVLLARRVGERVEADAPDRALPESRVERIHIGPLSAGALQAVVSERLDRVFPRPTLLRIHETSGGNPFYALEIGRALPTELEFTEALPVPESLEELVRARVAALPEPSRRALVLLSAMGDAETEVLRTAGAVEALETAVTSGIVARSGDRWRFTHPLLASSVYQGSDGPARRACHAVVSELVRDPLERARHLALSTDVPEAEIAASLDDAATIANVRGAPEVAAELGELARRLTPREDHQGRHRRAILAATAQLRAGDVGRARSLADETLAEAPDDHSRAEARVLMSAIEATSGNHGQAIALRRTALSEAGGNPALQAAVHQWLAANIPYSDGLDARESHARASLELAERIEDDFLRAGALAVLAVIRHEAGESDAVELGERAHALATSLARRDGPASTTELAHLLAWTHDRLDLLATFVLVDILTQVSRFEDARALLDELEEELAERDELLQAKALWLRTAVELEAGRWALADELARRERAISVQYERAEWPWPFVHYAELALHRGEVGRARELLAHARVLAGGQPGATLMDIDAMTGLVEWTAGDLTAAIAHYVSSEAGAQTYGRRDPSQFWWRAEYVEVLLQLDCVDEAVALLDEWEPDARRLGRDRVVAQATRCRGLVAAAVGDLDRALVLLEHAAALSDQVDDPFAAARARLVLGVTRRRARQKRGAREAIESALAAFEELGDVPWAARAHAELGRIGGRTREGGLTPAEHRVAALVAAGGTNREVASALFVTERTVATHLSHIYAKLGLRSRTELARAYEPAS